MRLSGTWLGAAILVACPFAFAGAFMIGCASAPPPPSPTTPPADEQSPDDSTPDDSDASASEPSEPNGPRVNAPEATTPPSTKSYDEAMSKPEPLRVDDDRVHLTDGQLNGPMRGVLTGCRAPSNMRITIKTAVQFGRAIGVTVTVKIKRPKSAKPPKPPKPQSKAAKAQAKRIAKVTSCVDAAVRAIVWPPSPRRDSFTTEF